MQAQPLHVNISTCHVKIEHLKIPPAVHPQSTLQLMADAEYKPTFLSAEWRHLAMLNWPIDPDILTPYIPKGTELDLWNDQAYCSLVGFMFLKTRIKGIPIPFHQSFPEVNLRFYVRRKWHDQWRRAVVFIRELVPKRMVATIARSLFNEQYDACPMAHHIDRSPDGTIQRVRYDWQFNGSPGHLELQTDQPTQPMTDGSEQQFIAEHYWGYAAQPDGRTLEYRVRHPSWNVSNASSANLSADIAALYSPAFTDTLTQPPTSAFLADGSHVTVSHPARIA